MKRFPRMVQVDGRGQLVIPKDVRDELGIEEGTGFWVYVVTDEGILLKKIDAKPLADHKEELDAIDAKADAIKVKRKNLDTAKDRYQKQKQGKFELV
ncbi:hypothetical protein AUJ68_02220 [Candidatus Woesearchaeota archaeon CG1_02_57_44]|nr:MAG: hypothetical protein AUJ68_02220 [Candidatus Woesearchaeota archaeon CG1_02_57_44]